jgi:hypothetical protein
MSIHCKATRDLLIHNKAEINHAYLEKAQKHVRGGVGQRKTHPDS